MIVISLLLIAWTGDESSPVDTMTLASGAPLAVSPLRTPPVPGKACVVTPVAPPSPPRALQPGAWKAFEPFEKRTLAKLTPPANSDERLAQEKTLRRLMSLHRAYRGGDPRWKELETTVEDALRTTRLGILDEAKDAVGFALVDRLIEDWLTDAELRPSLLAFWGRYARWKLDAGDGPAARRLWDRLECFAPNQIEGDRLRDLLRAHAEKRVAEAQGKDPASARRILLEARETWPETKGWWDAWGKAEPRQRTLRIASARLPTTPAPGTAVTLEDQILVDWLFRRLEPSLCDPPMPPAQPNMSIRLRQDQIWSTGERLTSADVRHSLRLALKLDPGLEEVLDDPPAPLAPFVLTVRFGRGPFDPWRVLEIPLVPQRLGDRELTSLADPRLAQTPVGTGPYVLASFQPNKEVHLRAHPFRELPAITEIRWSPWLGKGVPAADLVWDVPKGAEKTLKDAGFTDFRVFAPGRVVYLAIRQRQAALANRTVRLALSLGIDRDRLLNEHYRGERTLNVVVNGPFERNSWARAQPPRVPAHPYHPELAQSHAKSACATFKTLELSLAYPHGDERVAGACGQARDMIQELWKSAGGAASVKLVGLDPDAYRQALNSAEHDLIWSEIENAEDLVPLVPLTSSEPRLRSTLTQAFRHRQFALRQEWAQNFHATLIEEMALVPMWEREVLIAIRGGEDSTARAA